MPTLDTCRRGSAGLGGRVRAAAGGFTLLEILVVLSVVGLLAGIALPGLQQLASSIERSAQRKSILGQVEEIGYRAYSRSEALTLADAPPGKAAEAQKSPVQLPEGWKLRVDKPILYSEIGICGGGTVTLVTPDQRSERYRLRAPVCRMEPEA